MAEFSIQDVAFTGFRVVREHPRALAVWALYALIVSVAFSVIFVVLMGPDFVKLMAASARPSPDPARVAALFGRLAPGYVGFVAVAMVSNAILGAAMIRTVLRPAEDRFGFLRLGADERRQLGLGILTLVVFVGVYLALVLASGLLVGVVAMVARPAAGAMLVVLMVGSLGVMIFLGVRFSLAPALTFDRSRVTLFGSWPLTRGRFWPLLGAYVLTSALIAVVYLLGLLVIFAMDAILNGGSPTTALVPPDMASLRAYASPARLAQTVLGAVMSALVWPVLFTPPTAIYRALSSTGARAGEAFA